MTDQNHRNHPLTPAIGDQLARAAAQFNKKFGRQPRFAAVAPGRVNLIGEHTDYNEGFVLPMAIERQTLIVADRSPRRTVRIISTMPALKSAGGSDAFVEFEVNSELRPGEPKWANYVKGVVALACLRGCDYGGFDALIDSNVPLGGGLSSSAALEVSMITLLEAMGVCSFSAWDKALLAQKAEHTFAGVPCGIMDQAIAALAQAGHALLLDCRSLETKTVPLSDPNLTILIANTNVRHELTGGEYAQRRLQCESAAQKLGLRSLRDATKAQLEANRSKLDRVEFSRALHVVNEITRTVEAAEAAQRADWQRFGQLMFQSHASLRDDYEVSCPELDTLVDLAFDMMATGSVIGSRMTGGGFGGCTVSLVSTDAVGTVRDALAHGYKQRTGIEATIFDTRPAAGARVLALK
ncbi:MAG: galactokinase [Phycisphaeraceae bacterium]|nr:galactokinase [Phycisphaeraceae bacterium]